MNSRTIVYAGGFWSTNIGNAYYDLGCHGNVLTEGIGKVLDIYMPLLI